MNNFTILTHKKDMIAALEKTLGIVTTACKIVGISRATHYEWVKTDAEYKKAVEDIDNICLDFVESQLHTRIKEGDTTSMIFYLKTKGKKRGYIEKHDTSEDKEIRIIIENKTD